MNAIQTFVILLFKPGVRNKEPYYSTSGPNGGRSIRKFHQTSDSEVWSFKPGGVGLVHDDTPHINWRLAISGEDGLIRAANIKISTGRTNRPITH